MHSAPLLIFRRDDEMRICRRDVVPRAVVLGNRARIDAEHLGDDATLCDGQGESAAQRGINVWIGSVSLGAYQHQCYWVPCGDAITRFV